MSRQQKITTYGQFRSPGVDTSGAEVLNRLKGAGQQVGDIAFQLGAEQASEEGAFEGAQVDTSQPLELKEDTLSIKNKAFNQAAVSAYRADIAMDAKESLDRLQRENNLDPEAFQVKAESYAKGILKDMPDELKVLVENDFNIDIASRKSGVQDNFLKFEKEQQKADLLGGIQSLEDEYVSAIRSGNEQLAQNKKAQLDNLFSGGVESQLLDAVRVQAQKDKLDDRAAQQKILKQVDDVVFDESVSAVERLSRGQEFLTNLRQTEVQDLSPEQRDALSNVVESRLGDLRAAINIERQQADLETQRIKSNLEIEANLMRDSAKEGIKPDFSGIVQKTEELFLNRDLSGDERTSLLTKVAQAYQEYEKISLADKRIIARMSGDRSIPIPKNDADSFYRRNVADDIEQLSPEMQNVAKANFVSQTGVIPSQIKQDLVNKALSDDSDLLVQAVDLLDRLDEIPGTQSVLSSDQRAYVETAVQLSGSMQQEEAVQLARQLTDPRDKARVEAKEQSIKSEKLREDYSSIVENAFEGFFGGDYLTDINRDVVEKEYAELFEAFYKAGMDKDTAEDKATKILQKNWRESQFGFMKFPPEDYYNVAGKTEYIRDQLVSELNQNVVGLEFSPENVFLFSDETTERQASSGKPSYRIIVRDNNGELHQPVMLDSEGNPSNRWMPDVEAEKNKQLKENEAKAKKIRGKSEMESEIIKIRTGGR